MTLRGSLFSREVVPFYLSLLALLGATLAVDAALHLLGLVWVVSREWWKFSCAVFRAV